MKRLLVCITVIPILLSPVFAGGLDDLAEITESTSRRASSHDRTGGNDDNVISFAPGDRHVMLDADGPGCVRHIWCTVTGFPGHETLLRDLVIRMTWENADVPAVEVPLGDFFALGHGKRYRVRSIPVAVGDNDRALNCYWPMPFYKHARIEIVNNGTRSVRRIYYNIDYETGPLPKNKGLFHAAYRRQKALRTQSHENNTTGKDNYVILDTTGRGQYVGCAFFVDAAPGGWWGEGDEMIFIDDDETPSIIGTGSEDYFCNAWGYNNSFCYPFYGAPLLEKRPDKGSWTSLYRWHIPDPVRFNKRIRVTIEHLFAEHITNDYSSVVYWYQKKPITKREPLPVGLENHPASHDTEPKPASFSLHGTELEPVLREAGVRCRGITTSLHAGFSNGGYLRIELPPEGVRVPISVPEDGTYRVRVRPVAKLISEPLRLQLAGGEECVVNPQGDSQKDVKHVDLGTVPAKDGRLWLHVGGGKAAGLDHLQVERVK